MKKELKFMTICIVITTLIAVFFLGKWINEVRPRYEWQEVIHKTSYDCTVDDCWDSVAIEGTDYIKERYKESDYLLPNVGDYDYCGWVRTGSSTTHNFCYKKEKVRIN